MTRVTFAISTLVVTLASCAARPSPVPALFQDPDAPAGEGAASEPSADAAPGAEQALKQANNPIADITAISLHNYYIPDVSGTDESANTFWLRFAQPFSTGIGDWLVRASLPINTVPTGMEQSESGLGDANVFATYLFETDDPGLSYGIGPILGLPTATADETGTDQWSAGAAAVLFDGRSSLFQYGGLVTYQHEFAGSDRAPDVNLLAVQPFTFLQLGTGFYVRNAGVWSFDLQTGHYAVPVGFGLGKVLKTDNVVLNFFVEPQFTILHEGPGQPLFQVFFGFNTQILSGRRGG